jgi:hypothetical protein
MILLGFLLAAFAGSGVETDMHIDLLIVSRRARGGEDRFLKYARM